MIDRSNNQPWLPPDAPEIHKLGDISAKALPYAKEAKALAGLVGHCLLFLGPAKPADEAAYLTPVGWYGVWAGPGEYAEFWAIFNEKMTEAFGEDKENW